MRTSDINVIQKENHYEILTGVGHVMATIEKQWFTGKLALRTKGDNFFFYPEDLEAIAKFIREIRENG